MSGPPQSIINRIVLDHCDLLVGIFWTRIGTATTEYVSGAVEEIERHIATGKPAMIYFSEAPVKPDLLNSRQYKLLQKFKNYCRPKGLYEGFSSVEDFKSKFKDQLQIILKTYFKVSKDNNSASNSISVPTDKESAEMLSSDEQRILKAASLNYDGTIRRLRISNGTYVLVNKEHFINKQSAREIARWDAILESLVNKGYIKPVGHKGEIFEIVDMGYIVADHILDTE
jgi:sugar-specific transcriptional regulator TrmB